MWIISAIIGILIATYLILFLGWHIPNHLAENKNPPYYMQVLSILYGVIGIMAIIDLINQKTKLNTIFSIYEFSSILLSIVYIYTIRARREGTKVSYMVRILYAVGFGGFSMGIVFGITSNITLSILNGLLAFILCLTPIPPVLDRYLTPPSKESTAWYAVLHKFKYPRKEE